MKNHHSSQFNEDDLPLTNDELAELSNALHERNMSDLRRQNEQLMNLLEEANLGFDDKGDIE